MTLVSKGAIFHFHDSGRKGKIYRWTSTFRKRSTSAVVVVDGVCRWLAMAFEGDDSILCCCPGITDQDQLYKMILGTWKRYGFNMELFIRKPGDTALFTGWKFGVSGDSTIGYGMPDIERKHCVPLITIESPGFVPLRWRVLMNWQASYLLFQTNTCSCFTLPTTVSFILAADRHPLDDRRRSRGTSSAFRKSSLISAR